MRSTKAVTFQSDGAFVAERTDFVVKRGLLGVVFGDSGWLMPELGAGIGRYFPLTAIA